MPIRWLIVVLLLTGWAAAQKRDLRADLKVVKCAPSQTSSLKDTLYELSIQVKNVGASRLAFSNNQFVLFDDDGKRHMVDRGRYPQRFDLASGETATAERMFFTLPNGVKPVAAKLILGRGVVGEAKL